MLVFSKAPLGTLPHLVIIFCPSSLLCPRHNLGQAPRTTPPVNSLNPSSWPGSESNGSNSRILSRRQVLSINVKAERRLFQLGCHIPGFFRAAHWRHCHWLNLSRCLCLAGFGSFRCANHATVFGTLAFHRACSPLGVTWRSIAVGTSVGRSCEKRVSRFEHLHHARV
jgi:hypothetical protein